MTDRLNPDDLDLLDSAIAESVPEIQPPAAARRRILDLIAELAKAPAGVRSIRHTQGVTGCVVSRDEERGTVALLLHFAPGGSMDGHGHRGNERAYVVSGSCRIGSQEFKRGDFHSVDAGEEHGDIVSDSGCVLLVTADQRDLAAF